MRLTVDCELEPNWTLASLRTQTLGLERNIAWKDRLLLTPAQLGAYASSNLSWTRGSVLNRLTEERPELGAQLASASRGAREAFGIQAGMQLASTLQIVYEQAVSLGVPVGARKQVLLDAHAVFIGDGAIALHDEQGVSLRSLGTGSSRLLVSGLQRAAAQRASIALVDEVDSIWNHIGWFGYSIPWERRKAFLPFKHSSPQIRQLQCESFGATKFSLCVSDKMARTWSAWLAPPTTCKAQSGRILIMMTTKE